MQNLTQENSAQSSSQKFHAKILNAKPLLKELQQPFQRLFIDDFAVVFDDKLG